MLLRLTKKPLSLTNLRNSRSFLTNRISRTFIKIVDHYRILGLEKKRRTLTHEELSKRFRDLAMKYHPDINDSPDAVDKFMRIKDSYETIKKDLDEADKNRAKSPSSSSPGDFKGKGGHNPYKSSSFNDFKKQTKKRADLTNYKTEEEYIFYLIFGYIHQNDPERFFLKENAEKRKTFRERVMELRDTKEDAKLTDREFINKAFITEFRGMGNIDEEEISEAERRRRNMILAGFISLAFAGVMTFTIKDYLKNVRRLDFIFWLERN